MHAVTGSPLMHTSSSRIFAFASLRARQLIVGDMLLDFEHELIIQRLLFNEIMK